MNFKVEKSLENQVFSVAVKFDSFGAPDLTAEDEQALISDFGAPTIDIGGEYADKLKVDAGKIVTDIAGDPVKVVVNSKKVPVTTGFEASLAIDAKKLPAAELGVSLTTAQLVAEAKCDLFVAKIKDKLAAAIADLRAKKTAYEANSPETFTL